MACRSCGGSGKAEGTAITLFPSGMAPTAGLYLTTSNDECSGPYSGDAATKIWVVGIGTDKEEGFSNARRADAVWKARQDQLSIDNLPTSQLCHEFVVAALS